MPSRQRNLAQRNRLRGIIFIRSSLKSGLRIVLRRKKFRRFVKSRKHRKSAVKYIPKPHQQNRPLFAMKSSRMHGHHAARLLQLCAARSSLFVSGQRSHGRTTCRPRHRSRPDKPLRKNKRSSLKIHPSNPSIHPNRLPLFHRSCLFRKRPRSRRSASRSRLAAANRPHLSSHQHQRTPHQWSSCPPSVKNRNRTPHREKNPGAALIFGQEIQSKSPLQRRSQKRLYQKLIQSVREKRQRRTHSGRCSKRAISVRHGQPLRQQRSWVKRQQKR